MLSFIIHTKNGLEVEYRSGSKIQRILAKEVIADNTLSIDGDFRNERYGVHMSEAEIEYFKVNYYIWKKFLASGEDICLIREEGVDLLVPESEIEEGLGDLGDDWDVFFPFDKTEEHQENKNIELQTCRFGYFWGDHIYILSRQGASSLINIKAIRQSIDEEILEASAEGKLEAVFAETGYFGCDEEQLYSFSIRNKAVLSAALAYNAWTDSTRLLARKLLNILSGHAERRNIDLVLHGGSLLGHIRHNEIMPWDDDIDLGIDNLTIDTLLKSLEEEGVVRFKQYPWTYNGANSVYYKLWLDEGEEIAGYDYTFPFVDVWLYFETDDEVFYKDAERFRFPKQAYHPFKSVTFEGTLMKVPNDPLKSLDLMFKSWKTQVLIYPWSHRLEKPFFRPLKVPVNVDASGRLQF